VDLSYNGDEYILTHANSSPGWRRSSSPPGPGGRGKNNQDFSGGAPADVG